MALSTHARGTITELAVQKAFIEQGFNVSVPICADSRYDMIADLNGQLFRVQTKTARPVKNSDAFQISLESTRIHNYGVINKKYTAKDVDLFATCYNDNVYVIPQQMVDNMTKCIFRFSSFNNQTQNVRYADYFRLDNVMERWNSQCQIQNNQQSLLDYNNYS